MKQEIRRHLVEDWRDCWRWFSMLAMTIATTIQAVWLELPPDMKATLNPQLVHWLTMGLLIFGMAGRLMRQESKPADAERAQ